MVGDSLPSLHFFTYDGSNLLVSSALYHLETPASDSVSALAWDPRFDNVLAVTLAFDPTVQVRANFVNF